MGNFAEDFVHFLSRFDVELIRIELHPVQFVDGLAGLNAQQNVVGTAIVALHVVTVVGCRRLDAGLLGDLQHVGNDLPLLIETVVVNLEKEPVLAEDVLKPSGSGFAPHRIVQPEHSRRLPRSGRRTSR